MAKRFDYRTLVEDRFNGAGYVYSCDGSARIGFTPRHTIERDKEPEENEPILVW